MGGTESKPYLDDDTVDPACAAASELARQMVKGAIKINPMPTTGKKFECKKVEKPTLASALKPDVHGMVVAEVTQAAMNLGGKSIVGAIGRLIADGLWFTIFPPEPLTVNHTAISKLEEQELEHTTMSRINGMLHDFDDALRINYVDDKNAGDLADPAHRQRLHGYLMTLDGHLLGEIGMLMQESNAKIGLSCFLLLAGLRIALYQEMAVVDPENKDPELDPTRSQRYATPHTGVVAQYAREYAQHVETIWSQVTEDRKKQIACYTTNFLGIPGLGLHHWFDDRATGMVGMKYDLETFNEYVDSAVENLSKRFCYPLEITANWKKLIDTPINTTFE